MCVSKYISGAVFTEHPAHHESVCRSGDMCRGTFVASAVCNQYAEVETCVEVCFCCMSSVQAAGYRQLAMRSMAFEM